MLKVECDAGWILASSLLDVDLVMMNRVSRDKHKHKGHFLARRLHYISTDNPSNAVFELHILDELLRTRDNPGLRISVATEWR
jgi:hypothetical protein